LSEFSGVGLITNSMIESSWGKAGEGATLVGTGPYSVATDVVCAPRRGANASANDAATNPGNAVHRRPVMLPVVVGPAFGWLHYSGETPGGGVAILICPGLNWDMLRAHHALRILADELAMAGYPVMRLDYPETGDAGDLAGKGSLAVEHWQSWQQSIHAALDQLRARTGAQRLVLCGLRIGAMLATLVTQQRSDVTALMLLAPVVRGQSYLQQLQMQARLEGDTPAQPGQGLEFHELHFSAETLALVSQTDLRGARLPPSLRVAMFMQAASKIGIECERAWDEQGLDVFRTGFEGLESLLQQSDRPKGAPIDFSPILDWIRSAVPPEPTLYRVAPWPAASLAQAGWIETPQRFGSDNRLLGMLCQPDGARGDTAVIIVNTGQNPRFGIARFGVQLGRQLAMSGVASLRMDFAGLGDSLGFPGKENVETEEFETDRTQDICAAADVLTRLGYRHIAVHGICAGAYHALKGGLADPRIGVLLLINLPVLQWRGGDSKMFVSRLTTKPSFYLQQIVNRRAWRQLLHDLDVGAIIHAQGTRIYGRIRESVLRLAERRGWIEPQSVGRRAMKALARRGARTLLLFSFGDNGIDAMEQEFGRAGIGLMAFAGAKMRIVSGLDHVLTTNLMRRTAIEILMRFLTEAPALSDHAGAIGGEQT
jgi:alpha-beta hydrolase superfamily lysophospholipase